MTQRRALARRVGRESQDGADRTGGQPDRRRAKLAAGLLTGSAAMLAETAHSIADSANQGFVLVSIRLSTREPTPEQPFGYGRMRFLWTFVAAISMFLAGAVFAIGYGVRQLIAGERSAGYAIAYATLAISLVAEGSSWLRATRQSRYEADESGLSLIEYLRESRDPNVKMVLFEDTAALAGIALAFLGILVDQLTGSDVFDPAASIAIGVLLVGVAGWMAHDTSELLIGASARPNERASLGFATARVVGMTILRTIACAVRAPTVPRVLGRSGVASVSTGGPVLGHERASRPLGWPDDR